MSATRAGQLLCAAVTVAVTVMVVSGLSTDSCRVPGCTFNGGCRSSTEVTCDFQNDTDKEVTFKMQKLPKSIQAITVFNAKKMEVGRHFIKSYDNLERIVFGNICNVTLLENSLTRRAQSQPLSVTIENVTHLDLHSNAIDEWQHPHGQISIKNVESCVIYWSAFSRSAAVENVLFENISSLNVQGGGGAFYANITHLTLKDSTLNTCSFSTFGGLIGVLTLQSLEIKQMLVGCVKARDWGSLNLISCHLPRIAFGIFQGTVDNVLIESTSVGRVDRGGFNMSVSTLFIRASKFEELAEDSLSVLASESIILQHNNVTALRKNAFRRLRTSRHDKLFKITQLVVGRADDGSFRFIKDTKVILHDLSFHNCVCDVHRLVQQRVYGREITPHGNITEEELVLLKSLNNSRCSFENSTLTMSEFRRQQCPVEKGKTGRPVSAEEDADLSSASDDTSGRRSDEESGNGVISSYAAIAAVVVLFALIVVAVVVIRRRSRAGRGFCAKTLPGGVNRAENDLHVGRPSSAAAEEEDHMYCEVTLPTDHSINERAVVFSNSAACAKAPHEGAAVMEAEEEPLYEEISSPPSAVSSNQPPFCLEMSKNKLADNNSKEVRRPEVPDQTLPVYSVVVKNKGATKNQRKAVQPEYTTSHPAEDAFYSEVEAIGNVPLYAEVSVDIKDDVRRQIDDDLLDNPLYESKVF